MGRANPFRFSTKYQDDETDLLYYGKRYLNTSTERWLSRDPILEYAGEYIISRLEPRHGPLPSWKVTMLDLDYAFVGNDSANRIDLLGMCDGDTCGKDVTVGLRQTQAAVRRRFNNLSYWKKAANCQPWRDMARDPMGSINPYLLYRAATGWGVFGLTTMWQQTCGNRGCGTGSCQQTVHLSQGCYFSWDVNYALFGWMSDLCRMPKAEMEMEVVSWKVFKSPVDGGNLFQSLGFARAGYDGWPLLGFPQIPSPPTKYGACTACGFSASQNLGSVWPHSDWNYVW